MSDAPKYLRSIVALAEAHGWTGERTAGGHYRLVPPAGVVDPATGRQAAKVVFGSTPSDHRALANGVAYLRRCGVPVPHKGHTPKKGKR